MGIRQGGRAKGTKNARTLAREAEEKARIISEYEAERAAKAAESAPAPPPTAKQAAETIEETETLDLGEALPEDLPDSSDAASLNEGSIETADSADDLPLDLEPPVNPKKKLKRPPFLNPKVKPERSTVDKPAATRKSPLVPKPRERQKPAPATRQRTLGGVFRR